MSWWDWINTNGNNLYQKGRTLTETVATNGKSLYQNGIALAETAGTHAKWLWNDTAFQPMMVKTVTFGFNTFFHGIEQIMALRHALPALNNKQAYQILTETAKLVCYDVLPIVILNGTNNAIQGYFREDYSEETPWFMPYSLFLSTLTMVNYGISAFNWRQGAQAYTRVFVLSVYGTSAFNGQKVANDTVCTELNCTFSDKLKGVLSEQIILKTNQALIAGIEFIPYVGPSSARILSIIANGRYLTRIATPERCDTHKNMSQEWTLSVGLAYELSCMATDSLFENTSGRLPLVYDKVLEELLLLAHTNMLAHVKIPLLKPSDLKILPDIFNAYESFLRFWFRVITSGLKKEVPKTFNPDKNAPPLIPLSVALQYITTMLKVDIEKKATSKKPSKHLSAHALLREQHPNESTSIKPPGQTQLFFQNLQSRYSKDKDEVIAAFKYHMLPAMFQNKKVFLKDFIISDHWTALTRDMVDMIEFLEKCHEHPVVTPLLWFSKGIPKALYLKFSMPEKLSNILLMLVKKDDFWNLIDALKYWFIRHGETSVMRGKKYLPLMEEAPPNRLESKPEDPYPAVPAADLISTLEQTSGPNSRTLGSTVPHSPNMPGTNRNSTFHKNFIPSPGELDSSFNSSPPPPM